MHLKFYETNIKPDTIGQVDNPKEIYSQTIIMINLQIICL